MIKYSGSAILEGFKFVMHFPTELNIKVFHNYIKYNILIREYDKNKIIKRDRESPDNGAYFFMIFFCAFFYLKPRIFFLSKNIRFPTNEELNYFLCAGSAEVCNIARNLLIFIFLFYV